MSSRQPLTTSSSPPASPIPTWPAHLAASLSRQKIVYGNTVANGPNQYLGTVDLTSTDAQLAGLLELVTRSSQPTPDRTSSTTSPSRPPATSRSRPPTSVSSAITGTSSTVSVVPAAAHGFLVTTSFANPDVAGTVGTVTVTAEDPYGNTAGAGSNAYLGTVKLTSTDGQQMGLPASHAFTAGDAGSYTFTAVELKTAGSQTITARDSLSTAIAGTAVVNVAAGGRRLTWS